MRLIGPGASLPGMRREVRADLRQPSASDHIFLPNLYFD